MLHWIRQVLIWWICIGRKKNFHLNFIRIFFKKSKSEDKYFHATIDDQLSPVNRTLQFQPPEIYQKVNILG